MPDGSIVAGRDVRAARSTRVRPDGTTRDAGRDPGRPERCRRRARRRVLRVQQRRVLHARRAAAACCCPARSIPTATSAAGSSASSRTGGSVTDLYTECDGRPLRAPNDLVMDGHGGFWFTDHGIRDTARREDE